MIQKFGSHAIPLLLLLFLISSAQAQHVTVQNGACLRLEAGTTMSVFGNLNAQGMVVAAPSAVLGFTSDFDRYLEGILRPDRIIKDGDGTLFLLSAIATTGILRLGDGNVASPVEVFTLSENARLVTETTGSYLIGEAAASRDVGTGESDFGSLGVRLASGVDDLGFVTLHRRSGPDAAISMSSSEGIDRVWLLESESAPTNGRDLSFSWVSDDDNGADLTRLQIWKSTDAGTSWFPVGSTQDASSNRAVSLSGETVFGMYTVSDLNNPFGCIVACRDLTVNLDASGSATITALEVDAGDYSGCTVVSRSLSQSSFGCVDVGSNTIALTVEDSHGSFSSCEAEITVVDQVAPVVVTKNIVLELGGNGTAVLSPTMVDDGSSDACGIATLSVSPNTFDCSDLGVNIVTLTVEDTHGNSASATAEVSVVDDLPPTVIPPADIVLSSDPGSCSASNVLLGSPVASDNCSVAVSNDAPSTFPIGTTAVIWTATDPSSNSTSTTQMVTVQTVNAVTSVTVSPSTQRYSDMVTFHAEIGPDCVTASPATSVTFKVGSQELGTVPLTKSSGILTASLTAPLLEPVPFSTAPTGQMAPGVHTVTAVFNNINPVFNAGSATATLTILPEHATPIYTGVPFVSTPSVSSTTATIPLAASIVDHDDGYRGEIRNARVTFRMDDPVTGTVLGNASLQPVLVSPSNTAVGTVASYGSYTLTGVEVNKKGTSFVVYTDIDNYYENILVSGKPDYDAQVITVSMPGSEAVTGGGYLVMQSSAGYWAGTTGKKMNFGFTMKYNPSGKNLQGQANIIFRANDSIYQIKSNAINTMAVNSATQEAYFNTKANLQNITDPLNAVSLGGNLDLTVSMQDVSSSGADDEVSVHLARQNGQVLFSSHWSSNQTVRRQLTAPYGNGNIRVRSAAIPRTAVEAENPLPAGFELAQNYPNPFNPVTTITYAIPEEGSVRLAVYDLFGRRMKTIVDGYLTPGNYHSRFDGSRYKSGTYIYQLEWNGHIKVRKMTLVK